MLLPCKYSTLLPTSAQERSSWQLQKLSLRWSSLRFTLILYLTFLLTTDYKILEIAQFCCWKSNVNNKLKLCSARAAKGTEVMMIDAKLKSFQFRTKVVQSYLENRKQQCLINNDFPASERLLFLLCRNDLPNCQRKPVYVLIANRFIPLWPSDGV